VTHQIDELPDEAQHLRPVARAARLLLRECLQAGFSQCRLLAETGRAEVEQAGGWKAIMTFPPGVYDALVGQFKDMAGGSDVLQLAWRGVDVLVAMRGRPAAAGREDLMLTFRSNQGPVSANV